MQGRYLFLTILVVHLAVVGIYFLSCHVRRDRESTKGSKVRAFVMLVCPVLGPSFFLLAWIFFRIFRRTSDTDLSDIIFNKERVEIHTKADEEAERNVVPLEEAMAVMDTGDVRTLVLNVVRGDVEQSLYALSLALDSEDSEVSHYAAAVLQDVLNNFRATAQKTYREMLKKEEGWTEYAIMLIEYINAILKRHVLGHMEEITYVDMMEEAAQLLFEEDYLMLTSQMYENVCMQLLSAKKYEECEKWCERSMNQYPDVLSSYACQIRLYYTIGRRERFLGVVEMLKDTDIPLDKETLELIRVFS
jgi:hypothetical protein